LAPQEPEVMERILQRRIPKSLTTDQDLDQLLNSLKQEVAEDYDFSLRLAIGKYAHIVYRLSFIWRHNSDVNQKRDDSTTWMPEMERASQS
jgi:hypothetical protein